MSKFDYINESLSEFTKNDKPEFRWRKSALQCGELRWKPNKIRELAKPFTNSTQMIDYRGENEFLINQAGRYIEHKKVDRPEWFEDIIKGNQETLEECIEIALQYEHINEVPQRIKNRMWYLSDKKTVRKLLSKLEWNRRPRTDEEVLDIMDGFETAADMRNTSNEFKNLLSKVASNENDYPKSYARLQEMKSGHTTRSKRGNYKQRDPLIQKYTLEGKLLGEFTWIQIKEMGFNRSTITGALKGINGQKTAYKHIWKYKK